MVATRFDYHNSPFGQKAGISLYPVCGVLSGVKLALTGAGYTGGNVTVTVSSGELKLDGVRINIPSNITSTLASGYANLATQNVSIPIWINPIRKVKALTVAPGSATEGDMYLQVYNVDDYQIIDKIMKYKNSAWVEADQMSDIPISTSHNMLPLNDILTTGVTISLTPEVPVFNKTNIPPHVYSPSNAMARQTASIFLGEVTYTGGVATITKTMPDYYILTV